MEYVDGYQRLDQFRQVAKFTQIARMLRVKQQYNAKLGEKIANQMVTVAFKDKLVKIMKHKLPVKILFMAHVHGSP